MSEGTTVRILLQCYIREIQILLFFVLLLKVSSFGSVVQNERFPLGCLTTSLSVLFEDRESETHIMQSSLKQLLSNLPEVFLLNFLNCKIVVLGVILWQLHYNCRPGDSYITESGPLRVAAVFSYSGLFWGPATV